MEINWMIVGIVILCVLVLLVFLVKKNKKEEKKYKKFLNNDYKKNDEADLGKTEDTY